MAKQIKTPATNHDTACMKYTDIHTDAYTDKIKIKNHVVRERQMG